MFPKYFGILVSLTAIVLFVVSLDEVLDWLLSSLFHSMSVYVLRIRDTYFSHSSKILFLKSCQHFSVSSMVIIRVKPSRILKISLHCRKTSFCIFKSFTWRFLFGVARPGHFLSWWEWMKSCVFAWFRRKIRETKFLLFLLREKVEKVAVDC